MVTNLHLNLKQQQQQKEFSHLKLMQHCMSNILQLEKGNKFFKFKNKRELRILLQNKCEKQ